MKHFHAIRTSECRWAPTSLVLASWLLVQLSRHHTVLTEFQTKLNFLIDIPGVSRWNEHLQSPFYESEFLSYSNCRGLVTLPATIWHNWKKFCLLQVLVDSWGWQELAVRPRLVVVPTTLKGNSMSQWHCLSPTVKIVLDIADVGAWAGGVK